VGRSFFQLALSLGLALLSAALGLVWTLSSGHFGAAQGAMLLLWLLAASAAVWGWLRPACGELQWDGQDWVWHGGARSEVGRVVVRLDWQRGLLLAFQSASGARQWLWLTRAADAARWLAMRRALYATPGRVAPAGERAS
jgi:hypothetical protein